MRNLRILLVGLFCLIWGAGSAFVPGMIYAANHALPAGVKYVYVDLGSELENQLGIDPESGYPVAQYSSPQAINNLGQVVGYVNQIVGTVKPFWWSNGTGKLLPPFPGNYPENESAALDINDRGQIVGNSTVGLSRLNCVTHGVLWTPSSHYYFKITDLGTQLIPSGINFKGTMLGSTSEYERNKTYQLKGLPVGATDTSYIFTWELNNNDLVVGESTAVIGGTYVDEAACLWKNGKPRYLGALGGKRGTAYAVNDKNQIVGWAETATGNPQAFLWHNGVMQNLQSTKTGSSFAEGINNLGQVVGYYSDNGPYLQAFLWTAKTGMQNLQELVDLPTGVVALNPTAINDRGQIIGDAFDIYKGNRAFLLKPLPR